MLKSFRFFFPRMLIVFLALNAGALFAMTYEDLRFGDYRNAVNHLEMIFPVFLVLLFICVLFLASDWHTRRVGVVKTPGYVYLVTQWNDQDELEVQGVFSSKAFAVASCPSSRFLVTRLRTNEELPLFSVGAYSGAYSWFPSIEDEPVYEPDVKPDADSDSDSEADADADARSEARKSGL